MLNTKHYPNKVMGWAAICIALVVLSLPAFAAETEIRAGSLKVTPGVKYTGSYEGNVFYEENDTRDDYIHKVTPYIHFDYVGGTLGRYLKMGLEVDLAAYTDYNDNNWQAYRPYIEFSLDHLGPFYLKVRDAYVYTTDPYGTVNQYGLGTKTERWHNDLDATLGYEFGDRYALEMDYKWHVERFRENPDKWQNRIDHRFGGKLLVKVASKTYVFGEYRRTNAEYDEQNEGFTPVNGAWFPTAPFWNSATSQDYYLDDVFAGVRFHPTGRLRGEIKFGYGQKHYENDVDPVGIPYVDDDTWIAEANVNYVLQKNASLGLNLHRTFLGTQDNNVMAQPIFVSSGYVDTKAGIDYTHHLNRTTFRIGFDWQLQDYRDEAAGFPEKYYN
ncbi:hypothetical protein ACFL6B_06585, partial [Thermodesulfobacteriota bacterium]